MAHRHPDLSLIERSQNGQVSPLSADELAAMADRQRERFILAELERRGPLTAAMIARTYSIMVAPVRATCNRMTIEGTVTRTGPAAAGNSRYHLAGGGGE